jgi:hypothetical protein
MTNVRTILTTICMLAGHGVAGGKCNKSPDGAKRAAENTSSAGASIARALEKFNGPRDEPGRRSADPGGSIRGGSGAHGKERERRYYVDTSPYPASGCTDSFTPGNCVSDAQIRAEIQKAMAAQMWTGGDNKLFLLFTSSGEGSCFNATSCAYLQYCAYHSYFTSGGLNIIYGNEPYADASVCKVASQTMPNGDLGDLSANVASHEIIEAITDPLLNAWYDTILSGEIGDKCA